MNTGITAHIMAGLALMLVSACQSPDPNSLHAIKLEAQRTAVLECVTSMQRRYPNVPLFSVWDGCRRAYGRGPAQRL